MKNIKPSNVIGAFLLVAALIVYVGCQQLP